MDELEYIMYRWEKLSWWQQKAITARVFFVTIKSNKIALALASGLLAAITIFLAFDGGIAGFVGGFLFGYYVSSLQLIFK